MCVGRAVSGLPTSSIVYFKAPSGYSRRPALSDSITMPPHRIPKLPRARPSEMLCMGAAGVGVLTPLYLVMPGAEERLARQTTKWAPRWERNISFFTPPVERTVRRLEPPVARAIRRVEDRLPLESMAKRVDAGIRRVWPPRPASPASPAA
ncbi:hypothetical protein CDD80_637 [Ophiocordyceps camponoti-rufipedis]|uniref:4-coumarate:coenzyme A ligase n=1 Tax=Ophiocordyceps camponoti-rufipedis TaxID=2004952 RepID=A0A2C5ZML4_9HYPO|nr:hypothetical protein CDD80_637 [Ophiocordyceps camponoti-rufipedis]